MELNKTTVAFSIRRDQLQVDDANKENEGAKKTSENIREQQEDGKASSNPQTIATKVSISACVVQALFIGIFVLGVSMMLGDYSSTVRLPFSSLSLSTMVFGGLGAIVSEIVAQRAKAW